MTGWKSETITGGMRRLWRALRGLCGDDAYERYLEHWARHHPGEESAPLDRKSFFKDRQDRQWEDIRRCC